VSLLAIAVYQANDTFLTHRYREQAHSYKGPVLFLDLCLATKPPRPNYSAKPA